MTTVTVEITQESGFRCFEVKYIEIGEKGEATEKIIGEVCAGDSVTIDLDDTKEYELRVYRVPLVPRTMFFYRYLRIRPKKDAEASVTWLLCTITIKNAEQI